VKVGFIVNPIAGMGGSVGLKGTDGEETLKEAVSRGARPIAQVRAELAVQGLKDLKGFEYVTCSGSMGASVLTKAGLPYKVVYAANDKTTRTDTMQAVRVFIEQRVDLIVFAGGDGTARDILDAVGQRVPVLGIPAGVKMQSAVFAQTPEEVASAIRAFADSRATREAEVVDVDEEGFREGRIVARLYGYVMVPDDSEHLQASKQSYHGGSAEDESEELGNYLADSMEKGTAYILGPGSTVAAIARALGLEKTLLGVDVILGGKLECVDASEKDLLKFLSETRSAKIVVTPIGRQGFIFGRGNQQISADVIRKVGVGNVIVIATPTKLKDTQALRVDTGSPELDRAFKPRMRVVTGYKRRRLISVV